MCVCVCVDGGSGGGSGVCAGVCVCVCVCVFGVKENLFALREAVSRVTKMTQETEVNS